MFACNADAASGVRRPPLPCQRHAGPPLSVTTSVAFPPRRARSFTYCFSYHIGHYIISPKPLFMSSSSEQVTTWTAFSQPLISATTKRLREFLEGILWPDGPVCPHCGVIGHAYETKRSGVFRCAEKACRKDFTVTMKTVMERSHIALHKWLQGFHLMTSSKKSDQRPSASPHAWDYLSLGLVHGSSHS